MERKRNPDVIEDAEYWRQFYRSCLGYVTGSAKRIQLRWLEDINRSRARRKHHSSNE